MGSCMRDRLHKQTRAYILTANIQLHKSVHLFENRRQGLDAVVFHPVVWYTRVGDGGAKGNGGDGDGSA